jgi:hypothetical protein
MRSRFLLLLLAVAFLNACSVAPRAKPEAPPVPPLITERFNVILANLLADCPLEDDCWAHDMGPGCTPVWATLFGYEAGTRGGRDDLIRIGRVAAAAQANACNRALVGILSGRLDMSTPGLAEKLTGFPALLISGTRGRNSVHYAAFRVLMPFATAYVERGDHPANLYAGMALVLTELYRLDPNHPRKTIEQARLFSARISHPYYQTLAAMSWAAIARASGDPGDLKRAKAVCAVINPDVQTARGTARDFPYANYLSLHLALIHAYIDLDEIEPDGEWRGRATQLLEYVFSDLYFDGRFLVHHNHGERSDSFCSGCNFLALYLADRLYGTSLEIDPVPAPKVIGSEEDE